jgi:anti-sigma factor RsiW
MSHPDDGQLHALVDGELPPAEAAELDAHLLTCEACRTRLDEARALLGESDRIVSRLDLEPRRAPKAVRGRTGPDYRVLGLAASALLVVTVGFLALRPRRDAAPAVKSMQAGDSQALGAPPEAAAAAPVAKDHAELRRQAPAQAAETRDEAKAERAEPTAAGGQLANRAKSVVSDTPPSRAAEGVALNDLPPWKPKVVLPATVPPAARFRLDGLDVVSSRPLPGGGIRLVYSVNGTPVEFDQAPAAASTETDRDANVHELSWSRDDVRLTLRSALAVGELERLRQLVR